MDPLHLLGGFGEKIRVAFWHLGAGLAVLAFFNNVMGILNIFSVPAFNGRHVFFSCFF